MSHIHKKIKLDIRRGAGGRQKQLDTRPAAPSASITSEDLATSAADQHQPPAAQSFRGLAHDDLACLQAFCLTRNGNDATYNWYKDRVESRADGTCKWFLQHDIFQKWLLQESGPLLISADPGCGKSVLAKYLIDHVLAQQSTTVCYFFFSDQDQNTMRQALCALLHQLFSQKRVLIQHAMELYNKMGAGLFQSEVSLWLILRDAVSDPQAGPVIFVIDALDECAESQLSSLMTNLKDNFCDQQRSNAKFKVLMTSRPDERVVNEFHNLQDVSPPIHIRREEEFETIRQEVNSVIHHRVEQLAKTRRLSDKIKSSLASKLLALDRTYLWVHLVFDHLEEGLVNTEVGIDAAIQTLPKTVNEAYDQILNRSQDDEAVDIVKKALSIILAARRPLTLSEMNIAMRLDDQDRGQPIYDLDLQKDVDFQSRLRTLCGLFVSVHDDKIFFFHQTAREFLIQSSTPTTVSSDLQWQGSITTRYAHSVLADICMFYLDQLNTTVTGTFRRHDHYGALLQYTVEHWGDHCREAESEKGSAMVDLAAGHCTPDSTGHSQWPTSISKRYHIHPERLTTVLISSHLGLTSVTESLLSRGADIEAKDSRGRTALLLAAEAGHEAIIRLLLRNGASVKARDADGWTALICATIYNHEDVVRLLLENGANYNATDDRGWTALMHAARCDLKDVTRLLLSRNVKIEAKDKDGGTALIYAANSGHEAVTRLLLQNGARIEAMDHYGRTPLMYAVRSGHEAMVRLLLEKGADIETADDEDWTPLILAANCGHEAIVRLLLEYDFYDEAEDSRARTALAHAVEFGHEAVVRLLLETGAKVEVWCTRGNTALIHAVQFCDEAVVRLLLEHGAKVNARVDDSHATTILMLATKRGHEAITRLLLENGADFDATDCYRMSAFMYAVRSGQEAVTRLLLDKDAQSKVRVDNNRETPLMIAAQRGHEAVTRLLLENGFDMQAKDTSGDTALLSASIFGNEAVIRLLLENGADVEVRNKYGSTPLTVAADHGHEAIIRLLLENGADVQQRDDEHGQTALMLAAKHGHETVTRLLLEHGADIEAKDKNGRTALQHATENTTRVLLDNGAQVEEQVVEG